MPIKPSISVNRCTVEIGRGCLKLSTPFGVLDSLQIDGEREYDLVLTPLPTKAELERAGNIQRIIREYTSECDADDIFDALEAAGLLK